MGDVRGYRGYELRRNAEGYDIIWCNQVVDGAVSVDEARKIIDDWLDAK